MNLIKIVFLGVLPILVMPQIAPSSVGSTVGVVADRAESLVIFSVLGGWVRDLQSPGGLQISSALIPELPLDMPVEIKAMVRPDFTRLVSLREFAGPVQVRSIQGRLLTTLQPSFGTNSLESELSMLPPGVWVLHSTNRQGQPLRLLYSNHTTSNREIK